MQRNSISLLIASLFASGLSQAHAEETQLPQVEVRADALSSAPYYAPVSGTATKIPLPLKDVPQTVNVITREFIEDQNATSYQDVLRGVPGIGVSVGDGQRDQVTIRGFSAITDQFVDGVRDDALYFRDLSNVERIEVLKGPASVLYGRGSSGGLINRVTKKPTAAPVQSVALTLDDYGQKRLEGDLGLSYADGAALYRVAGAHEDSESFRKQYFLKRDAIAPSAQFALSERTTLLLQTEFLKDRRLADQGLPAYRGRPVGVPIDTYYGSANGKDQAFVQADVQAGTATLEHKLNERTTLRNVLRAYNYDLDRNYTSINKVTDLGAASTVIIDRTKRLRDEHGVFNQTELSHKTEWAGYGHDLLYGLEVGYQRKQERLWTRTSAATYNLFNPQLIVLPAINLTVAPKNNNDNNVHIAALYVQDLITLDPRWKVLAGLRHDKISQARDDRTAANMDLSRNDQVWSPRLGVVYQPDAVSSYYTSVSRSFQPMSDSFTLRKNSDQLKPEETTNFEVGAKYDLNNGRAALTAALFNLTRKNILTSDPNDATKYAALGTQRTRGLEVSLSGEIAPKWQMQAGYSYLNAVITESSDLVNGVSVVGNRPSLTPMHSLSLWATRDLVNGFSAGAGVQYVGDRYASNDQAVNLGSYVVADAGLYYRSSGMDVSFTLKNLFDRKYFVAAHGAANDYNMPGAPRTAAVTVRKRF